MQTIVLFMRRMPVAQGIMQKLQGNTDLRLVFEPEYAYATHAIRLNGAGIALIEVAESGEYTADYCMELCARLRRETPRCKLMLMCPEQDKRGVAQAVEAKRDGRIDDFVFYDSSIDYLASKFLSL